MVALRGIEPTKGVLGLAAFSDGVALKLVNSATNEPAAGVGQIMNRLATGQWTPEHLQSYLENPFWLQGCNDDRAFAYLVAGREILEPAPARGDRPRSRPASPPRAPGKGSHRAKRRKRAGESKVGQ